MIFSCTKKVLDKIKKYRSVETDKTDIGFHNWYVDLIVLDRKEHFLFTHSESLFSVFVHIGRKAQVLDLEHLFTERLKNALDRTYSETSTQYLELLLAEIGSSKFLKTNNRVITGCMNDFKFQLQTMLDQYGDLSEYHNQMEDSLNNCPMGSIDMKYPRKAMAKLLEEKSSNP